MLLMAPTPSLRALTNRKWRLSGPTAFLLFMLALFLATMAAVRRVLVRRVKACKTCRGYGIIRCRLCDGQGSVLWRGERLHKLVPGHNSFMRTYMHLPMRNGQALSRQSIETHLLPPGEHKAAWSLHTSMGL